MFFFIISVSDRLSEKVMNCFSVSAAGKMREPLLLLVLLHSNPFYFYRNYEKIFSNFISGQFCDLSIYQEPSRSLINFCIINLFRQVSFRRHQSHSYLFLRGSEPNFLIIVCCVEQDRASYSLQVINGNTQSDSMSVLSQASVQSFERFISSTNAVFHNHICVLILER